MRRPPIVVVLLVLPTLLSSCEPSANQNSEFVPVASDQETIVMARVFPQPGQLALFVADADGSNERPLVDASVADYNPVWAPDGNTIVFTSERDGSADLYRVRADGSELQRLTDDPAYDDQGAFSPDGEQLVFSTTRVDGTTDLWILELVTLQSHPLTAGSGGDFRPAWSPDGQWIAFSSDRLSDLPFAYGRWEHLQLVDLYLIRPDGSELRQITEHGEFCGSPKWTADSGQIIAYCMTAQQTMDSRRAVPELGEDTQLVAIDVVSGSVTELAAGPGVKFNPAPLDNAVLAYILRDADEAGIYYSNGTRGPSGSIGTASWSADRTQVVYHRRVPFEREPWVETWSPNSQYRLVLTSALPAFSPAGDRYTYLGRAAGTTPGSRPRGASVMVADIGGTNARTVYQDQTRNILGPQWLADGEKIAFGIGSFDAFFNGFHGLFLEPEDRAEGGAQIAMVNADGSDYVELTSGSNNSGFPSMSPDGKFMVYRTFGPEGDGLRIMDIETGQVRVLSAGYDNFPFWSPRGDVIMFSRQVEGDYEIYTVRPDGTDERRLTHSLGNDAHMGWSPDGEYIVFASTRMGYKDEITYTDAPQPYGEIFVMRWDGSDVVQLTDNQWEEGTPAWQPKQ
ncbi:MAG: hypothetical protein O2971_06545 [Proteobacteria bacterium]|nr:hypothetical protein [Pseudomonadota bacterium]